MKRRFLISCLAAAASICSSLPTAAMAGGYPDRPIRLIVPFPAGSITDVVARALSERMSRDLGQPFIVDNKPGANGIIGTHFSAQAQPDGYTIVIVGVTTAASNVSLFKNLPYDPAKDLTPIGGAALTPYLLVGSPQTPANTVSELFAYGQKNPDKLTYAYGSGSAQVFGAKLAYMGNMKVVQVPYRGGPQALADVMGNQVNLTFTDFANGLQQARAGKVKVYGTSTKNRFALAPDLPTLNEGGAKDFDLTVWFGLMGPAGLNKDIVHTLSTSLDKALDAPDIQASFRSQGLVPMKQDPDEFGSFVKSEITKWRGIIDEVGIEAQ